MLPDDFQHPLFEKSEREKRIEALCFIIESSPIIEDRQQAKRDLLNLIEGPRQ